MDASRIRARAVLLLTLGLFLWIGAGCRRTTYRSPRIVSRYELKLSEWSPHGDGDIAVLIVDGHRLTHVRGSPPHFLKVPQTNAIVFVTYDQPYARSYMTFHFYSLDAKKDVPVSLGNGGGGIGLWFGETNGPERVFSFTGTNICISFDGTEPRIQLRRNIDLSPRRYLSEEHLFFDENGAVTNHDVFPR